MCTDTIEPILLHSRPHMYYTLHLTVGTKRACDGVVHGFPVGPQLRVYQAPLGGRRLQAVLEVRAGVGQPRAEAAEIPHGCDSKVLM